MIVDILAVLACIAILWKAKQQAEVNSRMLRVVKETKHLRGSRRFKR